MDQGHGAAGAPAGGRGPVALDTEPVLPAYGGPCLDSVVPALIGRAGPADWIPEPVREASQVVLLVLDGLGWEQLQERLVLAPVLASMAGCPVTSVAPTTTATALSSITLGMTPAAHGVVGYRVAVGENEVLNLLRWRTGEGDARSRIPPRVFQPEEAFCGVSVPVVTRAEFAGSGFTMAHLGGTRLFGWRVPSSLPVVASGLLHAGEPFVYAYYDGIDKVAHERGLGSHFDAELTYADRLVGDLQAVLPRGAALLVVADHGQVDVGDAVIRIDGDIVAETVLMSGEGRFRWLHARPGASGYLALAASERYGHLAWVRTKEQVVEEGWFGKDADSLVSSRLGDVALVARAPVAFDDPADTGELQMVSRHGSLTSAEMWVPLLAAQAG